MCIFNYALSSWKLESWKDFESATSTLSLTSLPNFLILATIIEYSLHVLKGKQCHIHQYHSTEYTVKSLLFYLGVILHKYKKFHNYYM